MPDTTKTEISFDHPATPDDIAAIQDSYVVRLNADMFAVDDIDGATEGLAGSGNLNYLILQSQQTNEAAANADPFDLQGNDYASGHIDPLSSSVGPANGSDPAFRDLSDSGGNQQDFTDLLSVEQPASEDSAFGVSEGGFGSSFSALGAFGASNFDTNFRENSDTRFRSIIEEQANNGLDGINGGDGLDGAGSNGADGAGVNGTNGNNGNNGRDGRDGRTPDIPPNPPGGDDDMGDPDLQLDVISDLVGVDIDAVLDPVEDIIGDIDVDIDVILGDILSTEDGILPNPSIILDGLVGNMQLFDNLQIDVILAPVEDTLQDIVDIFNPVLSGLLPFLPDPVELLSGILDSFNRDGDTDLVLNADIDFPDILGLSTLGAINLDVPLDPVENLIGDTDLDLAATSVVADILSGDMSGILDFQIVSGGDVLGGINETISSGHLLESVLSTAEGVTDAVLGDLHTGDMVHNVVDNILSGDIVDNDQTGHLVDAVEDILGGDIIGSPMIGDVDESIESLLEADIAGDFLNNDIAGFDGEILGSAVLEDGVLGPVSDLAEGIVGDELLDNLFDGNSGTDTDLDISIAGDLGAGATLDVVENVIGDVDINVDLANIDTGMIAEPTSMIEQILETVQDAIQIDIDLLLPEPDQNGGVALDLDFPDTGVTESWPQAAIGDVLDVAAGLPAEGGITDGMSLPEPDGILSEGLNMITDTVATGGFGGLLGGHHGGGLFG